MKPKKTFVLCSFASNMFDWSEDVVSLSFGTVNSHVPYMLSNKIMCKDMSRSLQFPTLVRSMFYSLIYQCLYFHEYTWYLTHTHLKVFQSLTQCRSMEMVAHRARLAFLVALSCGDSYDHPYGSPCCHNLSNKWPLSSKPCCMYLCNKSPDHLILVCMTLRDAGSVHCLGRQSSTCPVLLCFICLGLYIPFGVIFLMMHFPQMLRK